MGGRLGWVLVWVWRCEAEAEARRAAGSALARRYILCAVWYKPSGLYPLGPFLIYEHVSYKNVEM